MITKGGRGDKNTAVELGHVSKRMEPVFGGEREQREGGGGEGRGGKMVGENY